MERVPKAPGQFAETSAVPVGATEHTEPPSTIAPKAPTSLAFGLGGFRPTRPESRNEAKRNKVEDEYCPRGSTQSHSAAGKPSSTSATRLPMGRADPAARRREPLEAAVPRLKDSEAHVVRAM